MNGEYEEARSRSEFWGSNKKALVLSMIWKFYH